MCCDRVSRLGRSLRESVDRRLRDVATALRVAVHQATLHGRGDLRHRVLGSVARLDLPALSKLTSHVLHELVTLLGRERCCGRSERREFLVSEAGDWGQGLISSWKARWQSTGRRWCAAFRERKPPHGNERILKPTKFDRRMPELKFVKRDRGARLSVS